MKPKKSQNLKRIVSGLLSLTMITSMSAVLPASAEEESTQGAGHNSLVGTADVLNSKGDVNGDGKVNTADKELLNKWLVRLVGENELDMENADVNMDGKVDILDLIELSKLCKPESGSSDEDTFEQHIGEDSEIFSEINTEDNAFKVSLDITASDDVTASLSASESEYSSVIESDMVVGVVPEFECEEGISVNDVALNFSVEERFTENTNGKYAAVSKDFEGIKRFNVFKYFDDIGMLLPVETTYDTENNKVTTHVDELGTYCLVDMEQWFENLGITPEEFATVNVSPSAVGMMGIPVSVTALTGSKNTVNTPIDVVFHPYAQVGSVQDKVNSNIKDIAKKLFDEYGRNGNVRIFVANYKGMLGVTNERVKYAVNEDQLDIILNRISGIQNNVTISPTENKLSTPIIKYIEYKRDNADRYYVFINAAEIEFDDDNKSGLGYILVDNNMTAVMLADDSYTQLADLTGGLAQKNRLTFSEDVANFIIGKHGYNNKENYKTIIPTGWKEISLDKPITKEYKKVIDYPYMASNYDFSDRSKFADTDGDGLIDLSEIKYYSDYDSGVPLVTFDENDTVILPTIADCMMIKYEKSYIKNALSRYENFSIESVSNIRILPIISDPTEKDTDGDEFEDGKDSEPMNYSAITIDDKLLDDSGSVSGNNPEITQNDLDKMTDRGRVKNEPAKMFSEDEEKVDESAKCYKNELVFTRTRKYGKTDAKFSITPSRNSDFAFKITGTTETKPEGEYTTEDFNSTVKVSYNKGKNKVKPVDYRLSDPVYYGDGTEIYTTIEYVFALEEGTEYTIYVNNPTNDHKGEYDIHVSEDNWVYAPDGAISISSEFKYPDYNDYVQLYYPESVLRKMLGENKEGLLNEEMNSDNSEVLASAIYCLYGDPEIFYEESISDKVKNCLDSLGVAMTFAGVAEAYGLIVASGKIIAVVGAVATGGSLFINDISVSKKEADEFKNSLYHVLLNYNSEKNLVYTHYKNYSSPSKFKNVYNWSRWTSNNYVNKYVEINDAFALFDSIRCTVKPLEFKDLKYEEYEWQNN